MNDKQKINVFWFRRDLRLEDNHGLYEALKAGLPVLPIFIFDKNILDKLPERGDKRVLFIHQNLLKLNSRLALMGASVKCFYGTPEETFKQLTVDYNIVKVFTNRDYEPYAITRDEQIETSLARHGVSFETYKDHVVFECREVIKDDGTPYTIFTPYSKKWKAKMLLNPIHFFDSENLINHFLKGTTSEIFSLEDIGFEKSSIEFPETTLSSDTLVYYQRDRDFPGISGTSRLGIHLRFGTVSIRKLAFEASLRSETFLNELIWRDFYQMILWNFPHVGRGESFKREYDQISWRNDVSEFDKWKNGQTGYPIVDAGMRELMYTGFMHNRVRMITASFLTKHLLIDWRWGEAWFAQKLLDFDLASNNGGWQWAAGSGCDAAPYFRVFNPYLQTEKFDKQAQYIRKWVPEFDSLTYVQPIVNHEFARNRCLAVYGATLKKPL